MNFENNKRYQGLQKSINIGDIVGIFNNLLTIGVEQGASDIHIEPYEAFCRIRIRIDGIMHSLTQYPRNIHENLISKFKIESGQMKPDEKRLPQDARVSNTTLDGKQIDLRANTLPTVRGEKLVMRIVDKSQKIMNFEELGIQGSVLQVLKENLGYPNGIILTTGPTGSGKTNTLYSCLTGLNKIGVNITTYEDPVESRIEGLNQAQIRSDIDFTFAKGLRGSLRQDPDIVMVGEIRDRETLETAMEAAMTGHLVFSTIHTNSSAETITRVMNLGAKNYQITGTFALVLAQRLVRKIDRSSYSSDIMDISGHIHFSDAKQTLEFMGEENIKKELSLRKIPVDLYNDFKNGKIHKPKSDENQKILAEDYLKNNQALENSSDKFSDIHQMYKGRIGIFEFMEYNNMVKTMLLQNKTAYEIEAELMKNNMINLERDAIFKIMQGQTSLDEVYRVVKHYKI